MAAMAKMNPPLRTARDREGIIEGIKDGSIDMIATDPRSAQRRGKGSSSGMESSERNHRS